MLLGRTRGLVSAAPDLVDAGAPPVRALVSYDVATEWWRQLDIGHQASSESR
jgi:hypothetical protein